MCADYYLGKDWVDLDDPSVTKDHVRKWRVLQDLKVRRTLELPSLSEGCRCPAAMFEMFPIKPTWALPMHQIVKR